MSKESELDITPDKSLIQKLGLTGYRTEQALAELIDNSIDARLEGKILHAKIELDFNRKIIKITDDGAGMDLDELRDGLTIAKGTKDDKKLGRFGLGMKSACSTLGKSITIITTKPNAKKEYVVRYDEDEWLSNKSLSWTNFKVEERNKTGVWNGTIIILDKLKIPLYPNQVSTFKNRYGVRYGPFLKNGQVSLQINTLFCRAVELPLQEDSKKELKIKLPGGKTITGWIGLFKKRSIKGDYGMHLFKNGRLIRAYEKFGFRSHPEVAKIVGELALDHIPVNFHKTAFIEDSQEYKEALFTFRNDPIVKETLRKATTQEDRSSSLQSIVEYVAGKRISGKIDTRVSAVKSKLLFDEAEKISINVDTGSNVGIEFVDELDGLYYIRKEDSRLTVLINKNSHAFKAMKNPLFLIALIVIEAKLAAEQPEKYREFIKKRNLSWDSFVRDWLPKEPQHKRDRIPNIESLSNYSLVDDLIDLHDFLKEKFGEPFQFTALSTLSPFLHNAMNRMVYTVHTIKGAGQRLQDLIRDFDKENNFTVLLNPKLQELMLAMDVTSKNYLIIREYTEKPTTTWAVPEKAWLDLFTEIYANKIPIAQEELGMIFENLVDNDLINIKKLRSLAVHRHMLKETTPYLEEIQYGLE
jgi:hypothetical protein